MKKTKRTDKRFRVLEYSPKSLLDCLLFGSYSSKEIEESYLYYYLCNFLDYKKTQGHNVKTIVIEEKYFSESYFKDFKNYYAESFNDYSKFTKRLHFFCSVIKDDKEFKKLIIKGSEKKSKKLMDIEFDIFKSYIGYAVIKPISTAFLGATFFKPYPILEDESKRYYNSIIEHKINLFGKELKISGCVFQEQDSVVSACTTSSLWSALYITNSIFKNIILSPSEITKAAGLSSSGNRLFPNQGLQNRQIAKVLKKTGLVSELRYKTSGGVILENQNLKRIIYAYNKMKIPILLGYGFNEEPFIDKDIEMSSFDCNRIESKDDMKIKNAEYKQHHLVTILGYKINDYIENEIDSEPDSLVLKSDRVYKLYSHNDQVGPYVRIKLGESNTNEITAWEIGDIKQNAYTTSLIIPLINTIRVKFENVISSVDEISLIVKNSIENKIEWDVYLIQSNSYKELILSDSSIESNIKSKVAFTSYPEYLWLARCNIIDYNNNEIRLLDVIYDPSDAPTGFCCFQANFFNSEFSPKFIKKMKELFSLSSTVNKSNEKIQVLTENHYKFFIAAFKNKEDEFLDILRRY